MDGLISLLLFAGVFYLMMRFGCGDNMVHGGHGKHENKNESDVKHIDPVCGKRLNRNKAHITVEYKGFEFLLCCPLCQAEFEKDPDKYLR